MKLLTTWMMDPVQGYGKIMGVRRVDEGMITV
jgi:hypothetical protein